MTPINNDTKAIVRSIDLFAILDNFIELISSNDSGTINTICRLKKGIPKLVSYKVDSCMGNATLNLHFSSM